MDPGDGLVIDHFTVERDSLANFFLMERSTRPGTYGRLCIDGKLWMSDTDAERRDHYEAVFAADRYRGGRGLINGLGLGCVLGAWLDVLGHVDVVEIDARVIKHVGGWFQDKYGDAVTVHEGDAYEIKWPKGTRWNVAWHDIWPTLCTDDLAEMGKLHRRYGQRVDWQGSWGRETLQRMRRQERRYGW